MGLFIAMIVVVVYGILLTTGHLILNYYNMSVIGFVILFAWCWQFLEDGNDNIIDRIKSSFIETLLIILFFGVVIGAITILVFIRQKIIEYNKTLDVIISLLFGIGFFYFLYRCICNSWELKKSEWRHNQYERGNYYDTFEHTKQSLMQNKNTADYRKLGYMYENGYGTTKDYSKAMQCYQKANAWREIGYMHYFGYGAPKNKDRAKEYFAKCDDRTDCEDVIRCFESIEYTGDGNLSNFYYYSKENAFFNLGLHYEIGKGVYQDYKKALHYYQKAADLGHSGACNNLGCMYDSGKGVARDYSLAVSYFKKGADLGDEVACNNLGSCYEYGEGGLLGVKPDKYKALKYYKKACDLGYQKGCENFRRLKNEMGIKNYDDVLF